MINCVQLIGKIKKQQKWSLCQSFHLFFVRECVKKKNKKEQNKRIKNEEGLKYKLRV